MRRPSGKVPDQPLTHRWARHREIARRVATGERPGTIANDMGMSVSRISIIMNSPMFQQFEEELENGRNEDAMSLRKELDELRGPAILALKEVLEDEDDMLNKSLKVRVAETILDRTGMSQRASDGQAQVTVTLEQFVQETLERITE